MSKANMQTLMDKPPQKRSDIYKEQLASKDEQIKRYAELDLIDWALRHMDKQ